MKMAMRALRLLPAWLACSVAYLAASMAAAFVAEGWDLDQLRERSLASRVGGVVVDAMWAPHDAAVKLIGNEPLRIPGVIPGLIVFNTLLGGALLLALLHAWRRWRRGVAARG